MSFTLLHNFLFLRCEQMLFTNKFVLQLYSFQILSESKIVYNLLFNCKIVFNHDLCFLVCVQCARFWPEALLRNKKKKRVKLLSRVKLHGLVGTMQIGGLVNNIGVLIFQTYKYLLNNQFNILHKVIFIDTKLNQLITMSTYFKNCTHL